MDREPGRSEMIRWGEKPDRNEFRHYMAAAFAAIIAGIVIISFYFIVKRFDGLKASIDAANRVLLPFVFGLAIAFMMNPIMEFFEKYLLKWFLPRKKSEETIRKTRHIIRLISSTVAVIVLVGILVLFFSIVTPQIVSSITYILNHINEQLAGVLDWANQITGKRFEETLMYAKEDENIANFIDNVVDMALKYMKWDEQSAMVSDITSSAMLVGRVIFAFFVGLVAAIYILTDKEIFKGQAKKMVYGVFKPQHANIIMEVARKARDVFYGFIVGKIIDSAIIGLICYISMLILGMPYPVLVAVIVGVTNVIPIFGPYIGAVPTVTIIFFTNPTKGIIFLLYIIILQQVDGNIIGPKILGDSTGLSAFWVLFAIVVGGGMFGVIGMLFAVPMMALIYYICQRIFRYLARKRGLPAETGAYLKLDIVDPVTGKIVMMKARSVEEKPAEHKRFGRKKPEEKQ